MRTDWRILELQPGTICAQCMPFSVSVYVSASRNILTDIFLIAFATPGVRKYIDSSFWLLEPQTYWSIHHYHSAFEYASESRKIVLLGVVNMDILIIIADIVRTISVIELPFDDPLCESIISTRPECFRRAINWPIIQRSRPMPAAIIWTHEYQDRETEIWRIWKHSDFRLQIRVQRKMERRSRIGTLRQARERLILSEFLEPGKQHWLRQRGRRYVELGFNAIPHRFRENYLFIPH